jgi:mRNA interferase RelE/StbE
MGYKLVLLKEAEADLERLEIKDVKRIIRKLRWLEGLDEPLKHGKRLSNSKCGDLRFRVGDFRLIAVTVDKKPIIVIVKIGHRHDVYKD